MSLLKIMLCSVLPLCVFAAFSAFAIDTGAAVDAAYAASQTMDIGIITGVTALAISAVVIYILRKRRK